MPEYRKARGLVCGQETCDGAGGEIEGVRELLRRLDIENQAVTLDSLHTRRTTARLIVERGGFYLMTVKGNRRELLDDLAAFDRDAKQVAQFVDNAMAESFFASLECELLDRTVFSNHAEARCELFRYIEGWSNMRRRHSSIGHQSPVNFEKAYQEAA